MKRTHPLRPLFVAFCALGILLLAYPLGTAASSRPPFAKDAVNIAWQRAQASGVYHFTTTVVETTHPAPTLVNVGRGSREERMYLEGETNLPESAIHMTLWRNGGSVMKLRDGVELRIEADRAYGREIGGLWQEVDADAAVFAPGNDLMAYLAGARNVREVGEERRTLPGLKDDRRTVVATRYVYEFNGPEVAGIIRDQLEEHLREHGELPTGLHLDSPDQFANAIGHGEVWIDGDGLPLRLKVHIAHPQQEDGERVEAEIQTDFSGFDRRRLVAADRPMARLSRALGLPRTPEEGRRLHQETGLALGALSVLGFVVINRRSKTVYTTFILVVIGALVVTPVLQGHQVYAFSQRVATERAEQERRHEEQREAEEARAALYRSDWDPHRPAGGREEAWAKGLPAGSLSVVPAVLSPVDSTVQDVENRTASATVGAGNDEEEGPEPDSDDDGDGLTYAQEERLGTDPDDKDTDGDQITDDVEVEGFWYSSKRWYLNPLEPDTNNDGVLDGSECPQQVRETESARSPHGVCQDTDQDGAPDAFDRDNDGDGVPDRVDLSPYTVMDNDGTPFDEDAPLLLQVDDLEANQPAFVDFQLRPQNEDHLWYALNVLDWPSGDERGQIQRQTGNDSTFEDVAEGGEAVAANSSNGDMRLVPMLEIEMPFKEGHYANLPVKEGVPITRTDGITVGQWLDTGRLDPYGIAVRPMNNDGDLVAYVPLSLIQDETGGDRVAFGGRMHYWPTITTTRESSATQLADWGLTQKVRVVWLVQMLTDRKNEDGEWVTDVMQVVRAYPEEWVLTGLAVREDHGLDVAITYEDPGSDEDLQYDDPLWALADGLQASFAVGRDQDDDGERDITVAEIDARFSITNSATITERFGISTTFELETETFAYDHEDFVAHIMMTETQRILSDTFTPHVDAGADAVTLLFSQETGARMANLDGGDGTVTIQGNQLTLNLAHDAVPLQTNAFLNWAPFRYEGGEWQSYPIAEYVDKLEVRLKEVLDEYEDHQDYEDILRGQLTVAKGFYLVMYNGTGGLVGRGDDLIGTAQPSLSDGELADRLSGADLAVGGGWVADQGGRLAKVIFKTLSLLHDLRESFVDYKGHIDFLNATIGRWVKYKTHRGWHKLTKLGKAGFVLGVVNAVILLASAVLLFASVLLPGSEALEYVMQGVGVTWQVVSLTTTIVGAIDKGWEGCVKAVKEFGAIDWGIKACVLFLVIYFAVTWGLFIYQMVSNYARPGSLAFNAALASMIASSISTIILVAISAIPVVGAIIATLIFLIDAITMLVCKAIDSEHWYCDYGISGLLSAGIQWLIYSANVMATIEDDDRLDITELEQAFLDPDAGLSVGNSVVVSATVENRLDLISWKDTNYDWKAGAYWWQYSDRTLASSTFDYQLYHGRPDIHEGLERFDIFNDWSTGDGRPFTLIARANTTSPLEQAGINQTLPLYLAEGFALPVQECWAIPIFVPVFFLLPVCYVRTETGTGHIDLGKELYYDVFPPAFDEFYELTEKDGGYALGWSADGDPAFPRLKDADGDGLRNVADDGADPDDHDWDADNDDLSDFFEVQQGTDPQDPDTDDDGLTDREEIILGTDPLRTDSDYDGLTDQEEVDGWEFVYDFAEDGSQLRTWVTADPLSMDPDLDQLTDFQERIFGFHPRVPSDPQVLTLDTRVREEDAPLLLLRLDEAENASAFRDDSGYANNGICHGDSCPASGHEGRYGNAPHFDGSDDTITADAVSQYLTGGPVSFGGWVYPGGGMAGDGVAFAFDTAAGGDVYRLGFDPGDGHFFFEDAVARVESGAFAADAWHHVFVTIEEDDSGRLYVDGDPEVNFTTGVRPTEADGRFSLGQAWDGDTPSDSFLGFIDEALVFDRALSGTEVGELMAGQYNTADYTVRPGDPLYYRAGVKNELFNRYAQGLLSVNFPIASEEIPPEDFILNPQEEVVMNGTLTVAETASTGVYSLTQEVDAMITDWREASDYAELLYHLTEDAPPFQDSSGSQPPRDATCSGDACPVSTTGRYGKGLAFDGGEDTIHNDNLLSYLGGDMVTYGAWVRPAPGAGGWRALMVFESESGEKWDGLYYHGDAQRFYLKDDRYYANSQSTFPPGQWYHVMIVVDEGNKASLYVNGTEENRVTHTFWPDRDGYARLSLGARWNGGSGTDHFEGDMDEVVVFNRALSPDQVQAYFRAPVFDLPLDEPAGADVFVDDSGFGNDAVCVGESCPAAGEDGITSDSQAALFSGDDYLSVDGSDVVDLSGGDFTLSAWVYPTGGPDNLDCQFRASYWNRNGALDYVFTRCEDWPIDHDWGSGGPGGGVQNDDFEVRWDGDFYFEEGDYVFRVSTDSDAHFSASVGGKSVSGTDQPVHISEGRHRVSGWYAEVEGDASVSFDWSPAPAYQPQGILGARDHEAYDYPTIERVENTALRVGFSSASDTFELTTDEGTLRPNRWNHVVATYDGQYYEVYVDGEEVGEALVDSGPVSGDDFQIGRAGKGASVRLKRLEVLEETDATECSMYCCDHAGEFLIEYREDGGAWAEVWRHECLSDRAEAEPRYCMEYEADIDVERTFQDYAEVRVFEDDEEECRYGSDGNDERVQTDPPFGSWHWEGVSDLLGVYRLDSDVYRFDTNTPAMEDHTQRFRSDRGHGWVDEVAVTWDYINTAPFRGRIDQVEIYRRAYDADQVRDLYDAGTLVLHMPLDDPPGASTFADALGQGEGTCAGDACPTVGVPGRDNFALRFDGENDAVEVNGANTDELQELTVATWVKPLALPSGEIMRFVTVGSEKAVLRYDDQHSPGAQQLHFYMSIGGGLHSLRLDHGLQADVWHHVAGTYDGELMTLYLDGSLALTQTVTGTVGGGDAVLLSHSSEALDGLLDEVIVYRRALSDDEIGALYGYPPEMVLTLDEPRGETFEDESGNGHHGSCSGNHCPAAGVKGQLGVAAKFDGHDDRIEVPDSDALDPGEELTLAAWVKLTDADPDQKIVGKTNWSHTRGYVLGIEEGQLYPEVWDIDGMRVYTRCGSITAGYWTHVAAAWETGGDLVAYINGEVACRVPASSKPIGDSGTGKLRVGSAPWGHGSLPANGRLDHVTLYGRTLSPREVQALFRLQAKWVEERRSTQITVDDDEPTSLLESDDVYRPDQDAILLISADDATSPVAMVELGVSVDGGTSYTWQSAPRCQDTAGNAAWCPLFEPTIGEGRYLLQTRATDAVGNVEIPSQVYLFLVDDTPPDPDTAILDGELIEATRTPTETWLVPLSGSVSDPDIRFTSEPGSGPVEVLVRLTARAHPTDTLTPRTSMLTGSDWALEFPLPYPDASGWYTLSAQATDAVGNAGPFVDLAQVGLDTSPPEASLDPVPGPITGTITTTLTLTGLVTETGVVSAGISHLEVGFLPAELTYVPTYTVAMYRFEEPSEASEFADEGDNGLTATCSGASCPSAGHEGAVNQAVRFSGTDVLTVAQGQGFADLLPERDMSVVAWVDISSYDSFEGYVSAIQDNGGLEKGWAIGQEDDGGRQFFFALSSEGADDGDGDLTYLRTTDVFPYPGGGWYHLAATYNGNTMRLYVNGELAAEDSVSQSGDINYPSSGWFAMGSLKDDDQNEGHHGAMDEVAVFERVLSPGQVRALYGAGRGSFAEKVVAWDDVALDASGDGVLNTTWAYTLPEVFDGNYQINLRPADVFGNMAAEPDWDSGWDGEIDTRAPRVEVTAEEEVSYLSYRTRYTCWAQDLNLVWTSEDHPAYNFACPCQTLAPHATVYTPTYLHEASIWYRDTMTDTNRLYELEAGCTVLGPALADSTMKACDIHGRCTQDIAAPSEVQFFAFIDSAVLTPTLHTIITSTAPYTLEGRAYARDHLKTLQVSVDGDEIDTHSWATLGLTQTAWSSLWMTPTEGVHTLSTHATDHNDQHQPTEHPVEIIVDVSPPTLAITPTLLTTTHRLSQGRVGLSGAVSDTNGIRSVQVSVDGGAWEEASHYGGAWQFDWALGGEPSGEPYTVTARAIDVAGHAASVTETVTVDLERPNAITLTLSTGGQVVTPGTTITTPIPADLDLAWVTSTQRTDLTYDVKWTVHTTETNRVPDPQNPISYTGPFSSTYVAGDAQRVVPRVTSRLAEGNSQVDTWGSVYVDGPRTPDYITLATAWGERRPYLGWMDSGCTHIGVDRRVDRNAPGSAAIDDQQALYVTWDSEALRLVWTGANWDYAGDLFVYLDTAAGGAAKAFNPFGESGDFSIDFSTLDLSELAPDGLGDLFDAETLTWIEDSDTAHLLTWNADRWETETDLLPPDQFRFDEELHDGHTDLHLPFEILGIDDPAGTPLALVAFATEDASMGALDELRVWGTMPPGNPLNSSRGLETLDFAPVASALPLTQVYVWPSLGPAVCPNASFGDADVQVGLSADPPGATYGFLQSDLFWLWEELSDYVTLDDLDVPVTLPVPPTAEDVEELEQALEELERDLDVLLHSDVSETFAFMDVDHPHLGAGDRVSYTLDYVNRGTETATNVRVYAAPLFALSFGTEITQAIQLGNIDPGETGRVTFQGQIDPTHYDACTALNPYNDCLALAGTVSAFPAEACEPFNDWDRYCEPFRDRAGLVGLVIDNVHGLPNPLDYLWAVHEVDSDPPRFFDLQQPAAFVNPGLNTLRGYAYDASGVPGIALNPGGGEACVDPTPMDGRWSCDWDASQANGGTPPSDGTTLGLQLRAGDGYGQESVWTEPRTLIVDALPPTVTFSAETTTAYSDTVVADSRLTFRGVISDNRGVGDVTVCLTDAYGAEDCGPANVQAAGRSSVVVTDVVVGGPQLIPDCAYGALERTFDVPFADDFIIGKVQLGINAEHGARDTISATLISPQATAVQVLGSEEEIPLPYQNYDVLLYDAATAGLDDFKGNDDTAYPSFDREARPYEPMRTFRGEGSSGQWMLKLCDTEAITTTGTYSRGQVVLLPLNTAARRGSWSYGIGNLDELDGVGHIATVYGTDVVGNESQPISLTFEIDNVAPAVEVTKTVTLTVTAASRPPMQVLAGTATDGGRIVQMYAFVKTPQGDLWSRQIGRGEGTDAWWFDLEPDETGDYSVWVNAIDAGGNTSQVGPFQVHIMAGPIADAGPDGVVYAGEVFTLDGSGSHDPDGDPLAYGWTQAGGPPVTLSHGAAVSPTVRAPWVKGPIRFTLQVTDTAGLTDTDTAVVDVRFDADVVITKTVAPATSLGPGQPITYTLTFTNTGPSAVTDVVITDTVPVSVTQTRVIGSGIAITETASGYVWAVQDLGAGEGGAITITGVLSEPLPGGHIFTNTATIDATGDIDSRNNSASAAVRVSQADLAVDKAVSDVTPSPGWTIAYTVSVTNNGPDDATGVLVSDALPSGVRYETDDGGGKYDPTTGVWTVGALDAGSSAALHIAAAVDAPHGTTITNTALVSGADQGDSDTGNNSDDAVFTARGADLAVDKTVDNATPREGEDVTYAITVTNQAYTSTAVVRDVLPNGVTYASDDGGGSYDAATGEWAIGLLRTGERAALEITVAVDSGTRGNLITNTAAISASSRSDLSLGDDTAEAVIAAQHPDAVIIPVTPGTGGTLVYTDGRGYTTTVEIPTGAVSDTSTIILTPLDGPAHPTAPLLFGGHAFNLEVYKGPYVQPGYVFAEPLSVTIHYSDEGVAGIVEPTLGLHGWTGSEWEDAACGGYEHHEEENWLSVAICSLPRQRPSEFALLGEPVLMPVGGATLAVVLPSSLGWRAILMAMLMVVGLAVAAVLVRRGEGGRRV